jgi:hypothetical protein
VAIGGGGLVLVVVVCLVVWLLDPFRSTRVTVENFEKLKLGMTEPELVAILGPPTEVTEDWRDRFGKVIGVPIQFDGPKVRTLRWKYRDDEITVTLVGERAQSCEGYFDHGRHRPSLGRH